MSSLTKPILFLDFDRTLFDTEKFYAWLGSDRHAGILALMNGTREAPDFSRFLYPDTLPFLSSIRGEYRLVLLSYAQNTTLQRRKIRGAGMTPFFDDILITTKDKAEEAEAYIARFHQSGWIHVFVDDDPLNIDHMKKQIPSLCVVQIKREKTNDLASQDHRADTVVHDLSELSDRIARLGQKTERSLPERRTQ